MGYAQKSMPPDALVSPSKYRGGRERRKGKRNAAEENDQATDCQHVNKQDKTLKDINRRRERVTPAKRETLRIHRYQLPSTSTSADRDIPADPSGPQSAGSTQYAKDTHVPSTSVQGYQCKKSLTHVTRNPDAPRW